MKREILFRGKRMDNGKWAYGFLSWNDSPRKRSYHINNDVVYTDTVGQFTGLTDKNGTKIFEGDIVKFYDDLEDEFANGIIVCNADFCSFCVSMKGHEDIMLMVHWQYEVIGNIFDNKELIK